MPIDEAAKRKPRKPRKKGQKRKSSKHSDLYTDEDPKGTIHGLGFKDAATARKGRAIINKARRKHAHKVQAALVMKQRAKVAKERTKDPEKKKNLNAAYKVWSEYLEKLKAKTKKMKKKRVDEKKRKHPRYRPPRKDPKTGKYDNPCGKGFKPGAQTGVLTKIGPQSGRRVSNCEPIKKKRKKKKNEAVLEAVIKRLLSEQPYKTPGQEYIALFLDGPSRDKLTDTLDDPPPGWTLHADHMTVKFGSEGVPASYLGPATIRVVGVALNDRVMTAKVETDVPTQNSIPHITIATAPGAKPRESNDFSDSDFEEVQAFDLTGEVKPKFSDTLQKKMPSI